MDPSKCRKFITNVCYKSAEIHFACCYTSTKVDLHRTRTSSSVVGKNQGKITEMQSLDVQPTFVFCIILNVYLACNSIYLFSPLYVHYFSVYHLLLCSCICKCTAVSITPLLGSYFLFIQLLYFTFFFIWKWSCFLFYFLPAPHYSAIRQVYQDSENTSKRWLLGTDYSSLYIWPKALISLWQVHHLSP